MIISRLNSAAHYIRIGIIVLGLAFSTASAENSRAKPNKLSSRELTHLLEKQGGEVYYGGLLIPAADSLAGPVVVIDGALDIQDGALLSGDAWIINGKLILNGTARLEGRAELVNSSDFLSRRAVIRDGIRYYKCECRLNDEKYEQEGKLLFVKHEDPRAIKTKLTIEPGQLTRVDYDLVHVGLKRQNTRHKKPHIRGHALLHFSLTTEKRGYLGFDVDVAIPFRGEQSDILVQAYKKTFSNDYWQLSPGENSAMLFLAGYDFADYYEQRGGALGLRYHYSNSLCLQTMVSFHQDMSMITRDLWTVFDANHKRLPNPAIDRGDNLTAEVDVTYDSREDVHHPGDARFGRLQVEKGFADGPGDFSYTTFTVETAWFNRLPYGLHWDMRGQLFSSFDRIPRQASQSLNGYGGVRGLNNSPFPVPRGDRLALLSGELRAGLPQLPVIKYLYTSWDAVLFTDIGLLAEASHKKAPLRFLDTSFDNWKKTVGLGISGQSFFPYLGIYLAQDLDRNRRNPRLIVRFNRSF
jgi:hypothetical protein